MSNLQMQQIQREKENATSHNARFVNPTTPELCFYSSREIKENSFCESWLISE